MQKIFILKSSLHNTEAASVKLSKSVQVTSTLLLLTMIYSRMGEEHPHLFDGTHLIPLQM